MFRSVITRSLFARPVAVTQRFGGFVPHPFRSMTRGFAGRVDVSGRVIAAVEDFVKTRKLELEHYEAVDPADKEEVRQLIDKLSSAEPSRETTWASLGLDGLDEVEMVMAIESQFGVTLEDEEFHSIHSVEDAVRVLTKYAPKQG
jgi:acyl carrier protein